MGTDSILSEKERQRAEFVGVTLAIILGDASEITPLQNGGVMLKIGPSVWQTWLMRAESFRADHDPPDRLF
jgi:hypothetical protein